jgi:FKBP-type peptidyl-prolyl cis-trans isomerase FkpA
MKKIILGACALLSIAACNVNYEKTPSGLVYKIYPGKGGEKLKAGKLVKYSVDFLLTNRAGKKDTSLNAGPAKPGYIEVDTSKKYEYSFVEILPKLSVGDSALVVLSTDSLKKKNQIDPNDNTVFVKGSSIQCRVKILKSFKDQTEAIADYQGEVDKENKSQIKSVENYMTQKGIKGGVKTKSGAYVVIENAGDPTRKADTGKVAYIKYKGYLQSNGEVFDTNFDSSKGHTDPISVVVGRQPVIPAWEEALPYFAKGGSGKIFVPAFLGYGQQGRPPVIPPDANLIFDIQVVDVQNAPPPSKQNTMAPQPSKQNTMAPKNQSDSTE